ncbi:hypothetical protein X975_18197, partial [Stegodyphus mimosarum]
MLSHVILLSKKTVTVQISFKIAISNLQTSIDSPEVHFLKGGQWASITVFQIMFLNIVPITEPTCLHCHVYSLYSVTRL